MFSKRTALVNRGMGSLIWRAVIVGLFVGFVALSVGSLFAAEKAEPAKGEKTQKERLAECKDLFAGANYVMALECCFEVVAMAPETEEGIEALFAAGVCYFRLAKYEEALPLFETIVEQYSRSASVENAKKMAEDTRKKMAELGLEPKSKEQEKQAEQKVKRTGKKPVSGPTGKAIDLSSVKVSNVFSDTRLAEALSEISMDTGIRFIIDPAVSGVTTHEFIATPLADALEAMLSPYGFVFKAEEEVVVIGTPNPESPLFPRLAETEIYRPENLKADEIPKLLPKFYQQFISSNNERNILVISAPKDVLADASGRVKGVDVAQKQVMIELLVVEIKLVKGLQLGVDWSVSGDKEYHGPKPVNKPVTLRSLAIDWTTLLGDVAYTSSADDIKAIAAKLNYLLDRGTATVRANPRVAALDNSLAEIYIGTEGYYRILAGSDIYPTTRLEAIKSGVTLRVRPKISGADMVRLEVAPEVSDVTGRGPENLPEIAKRSVSTTLKVKDGQTIVLGGLYQKRKTNSVSKVPLLGHIPLMGALFTKKVTEFLETEVVIFITPRILEDTAPLTAQEAKRLEESKDTVGSKIKRFLFNE